MATKSIGGDANVAVLPQELGELRTLYQALQDERGRDLERHRLALLERDVARRELADQYEAFRAAEARAKQLAARQIESPAILRAGVAERTPMQGRWLGRLLAAVLLRFAKQAVRQQRYAAAEILYQAIALFRPRAFLLKQIGNMLYQQGLYAHAELALDVAQKLAPTDLEVQFFLDASRAALGGR